MYLDSCDGWIPIFEVQTYSKINTILTKYFLKYKYDNCKLKLHYFSKSLNLFEGFVLYCIGSSKEGFVTFVSLILSRGSKLLFEIFDVIVWERKDSEIPGVKYKKNNYFHALVLELLRRIRISFPEKLDNLVVVVDNAFTRRKTCCAIMQKGVDFIGTFNASKIFPGVIIFIKMKD